MLFRSTELHPLRLGWYLTPDVRLALVAGLVGSFPLAPAFHRWRDRQPGWRLHLADATRAAMLLAQAAGRLIRTATDRGVVAVFDNRLGKANYRWELVKALPPMKRTRELQVVLDFFADR